MVKSNFSPLDGPDRRLTRGERAWPFRISILSTQSLAQPLIIHSFDSPISPTRSPRVIRSRKRARKNSAAFGGNNSGENDATRAGSPRSNLSSTYRRYITRGQAAREKVSIPRIYSSPRAGIMDRHIFHSRGIVPSDSLKFLFRKITLYFPGPYDGWKYLPAPMNYYERMRITDDRSPPLPGRFLPRAFSNQCSVARPYHIFPRSFTSPPQARRQLRSASNFTSVHSLARNNRNIPISAYSQAISLKLPTRRIYSCTKFPFRARRSFLPA